MCKEATEIQNEYPRIGDYFIWEAFDDDPQLWLDDCNSDWSLIRFSQMKDNSIWLPRQDQLQEMMEQPNIKILWGSFNWIFQKPHNVVPSYSEKFTSLEQAWLAFVMDKLYNKKWDNKKWVK